jgi:ABC-type polysaccharide/polyol phosphate transport system ATPase subunit
VLIIQKLSKRYLLYDRPWERLLSRPGREFWALRDVSIRAARGEFLAIVGPNGSGKSTLLQIVSGILQPTRGRVSARGRIAALLELGAGFNPELSGRENVLINSEVLGVPRKEMEKRLAAIEEFAGIGEYIHRPVKEYSSGMYVRLAFAGAIHVDPDILIVDEALAVGDAIFANRCIRKFEELKERGTTVLFVSHDLGLVKRLADRAVLMLNGHVEADGSPNDIVNRYIGLVHEWQARPEERGAGGPAATYRHGDRTSRIDAVTLLNSSGERAETIASGSRALLRVAARFVRAAEDPIVGILIRNRLGMDVFGTNTRIEGRRLGNFAAGDSVEVDFGFECLLAEQQYTVTAAVQNWDGSSQDWLDGVLAFGVTDRRPTAGVASFPVEIAVRRDGARA